MEIADQARTKQFIVGGLKWTKKAKNSYVSYGLQVNLNKKHYEKKITKNI